MKNKSALSRRSVPILLTTIALLSVFPGSSMSTIMPYPPSIAKMTDSSDLVMKAKVVLTVPAKFKNPLDNDWWVVNMATVDVLSNVKDESGLKMPQRIQFLYRSDSPSKSRPQGVINVGSENYAHFNLVPGKTYILFAKKTKPVAMQQLSTNYTMRSWEGFFKAADDANFRPGINAHDAIWVELNKLLKSKTPGDVSYARKTLLELSSGSDASTPGTEDFTRQQVLKAIFSSGSSDPFDATTLGDLLELVGSASPYINDNYVIRYLWFKASKPIDSWAAWQNEANTLDPNAAQFLIATAQGKASAVQRALAVASLGLCQNQNNVSTLIKAKLGGWLSSPIPEIRASAALLACDYPALINHEQHLKLLNDESADVRQKAALAVGISQDSSLLPELDKMLKDKSLNVQGAAALSLMTFPAASAKKLLLSHVSDPEFGLAFVARLGSFDPAEAKDLLLSTINTHKAAQGAPGKCLYFHNGLASDPFGLCTTMLIKYLDSLTGLELHKKDKINYLDSVEKACIELNSNAIYTVLLTHGLNERAQNFKKKYIEVHGKAYEVNFQSVDNNFKVGYPPRK